MTDTHYNTTHETGQRLLDLSAKAQSQEAIILNFFQANSIPGDKYSRWSPSQIRAEAWVLRGQPEITSVRRAMTNLTSKGLLTKTDHKRKGPFDHWEYTWCLSEA